MFWKAETSRNPGMADQEDRDSLVCLQCSEAFPLKPIVMDDPDLRLPYHRLCGESVTYLGRASDAVIALSSYRLLIRHKGTFVNVPVMLIESVECRDLFYLVILCKDGKTYRCKFATNEQCQDWLSRLMSAIAPPNKLEDLFAFPFHAWCFDQLHSLQAKECPGTGFLKFAGEIPTYSFMNEVCRQGYDTKLAWQIIDNSDYKYCSTYPIQHIIPAGITDKDLNEVISFRASKRFPSVVWRHQQNGAVIARCSQPGIGWFGWRCPEDEQFIESILQACTEDNPQSKRDKTEKTANGTGDADSSDRSMVPPLGSQTSSKKVLIVDARSYTAAWANRAKGGGCEFPEYYPSCDIKFMGLANIHSIRKSFQGVRNLCWNAPDTPSWLSLLEATKWLQHLALLLKSAVVVVTEIAQEANPVIVHCSDGWDRTPQIVALAQLMLDPYYRTLEGFQVLVEREWLEFGHKFGDRCGHKPNEDDTNQRCPVFLQWLDCIHQLMKQYPVAFEFNQTFLGKLVQHVYSCLFGTFLCNNAQQRSKHSIKDRTCSVWALLAVEGHKYKNYLFSPNSELVLYPCCSVRSMHLWTAVFLADSTPATCEELSLMGILPTSPSGTLESGKLMRTRSVDDLHTTSDEEKNHRRGSISDGSGNLVARRLSDPSLSELKLDGMLATPPQTRKVSRMSGVPSTTDAGSSDLMPNECSSTPTAVNFPLAKVNSTLDEASSSLNEAKSTKDKVSLTPGEISLALEEVSSTSDEVSLNPDKVITNSETKLNGLTNSHCNVNRNIDGNYSADFPSSSSSTDKNSKYSIPIVSGELNSAPLVDAPMNTSTDTLTGDFVGDVNPWRECNGHTAKTRKEAVKRPSQMCQSRTGKSVSISTSTSDLSSSYVVDLPNSLVSLSELNFGGGLPEDSTRHVSSSSCFVSAPSSPAASRSDTPPLEAHPVKGSPSGILVGRHLDEDGLTSVPAPEQDVLLALIQRQRSEVSHLRQQLTHMNKLLQQTSHVRVLLPPSPMNGICAEESVFLTKMDDDKDRDASSRCGSLQSDVSWEEVDETETRRTLWVPDYSTTRCFKCNAQFNVLFRKHHCRSCGQIFCNTCTGYVAAIPREQLYRPERVCKLCYDSLELNNGRKTPLTTDLD